MKIRLLAFGIAKELLQQQKIDFEITPDSSIQYLKQKLIEQYPDFNKLAAFAIAVNNEYQSDDFLLSENDEIAIIPPVSGG